MHWATLLRLQQKKWVLGLRSMGASLPPHHGPAFTVPYSTQKKCLAHLFLGPPSTTRLPAPSQEEQKAFLLQPVAAECTEEGINIYRPWLFLSSVPSPCDYVSALLSWPAFRSRNSPHSPSESTPELGSLKPVLIHNPK